MPLHQHSNNFTVGKGILQSVSQDKNQGKAFPLCAIRKTCQGTRIRMSLIKMLNKQEHITVNKISSSQENDNEISSCSILK